MSAPRLSGLAREKVPVFNGNRFGQISHGNVRKRGLESMGKGVLLIPKRPKSAELGSGSVADGNYISAPRADDADKRSLF